MPVMPPYAKYVYRKSDNVFLFGSFGLVEPPNYVDYGIALFTDATLPDLRLHRFDAVLNKRLATAEELTAMDEAHAALEAELTSRQTDLLTTMAFLVRANNVAAWNAMTAEQKRTAVLNQADVWKDLRIVVEKL